MSAVKTVLVAKMVITVPDMTRIIKFFKLKRHSALGYSFVYEDYGTLLDARKAHPELKECNSQYTDAALRTAGGILEVYRDTPALTK